ncbi:MAG: thioredoxin family protein [Chlorobi bacterium]|nr:thioredoxin family protein [Chlorobiota bacterium]
MKRTSIYQVALFLFFSISLFAQQKALLNLKQINNADSLSELLDSRVVNYNSIDVYELNDSLFKEILFSSDIEYHLILFYVDWCKPCSESMPIIKGFAEKFEDINIYYIYPDRKKNLNILSRYLNENGIFVPTFILDDMYKGNVKKRFVKFRNQICDDCNEILGFPSVLVLDDSLRIIYRKTGDLKTLDKLLKELILK